uniref:Uncharacterized protein n=1 Tax=Aegilops tauschii subsp. strangulata TaxID=200361 RepID=A0A453T468_AEGTS
MSGSASIQTGRRPVHRGESDHANPRRHGDGASPPPRPVLARLSSRGWSRTAPPVPSHQAQDDGAVDGWARDGTESPLLYGAPAECPEAADPPPLRGYVSSAARARPSTTRWEEPCHDMLPRSCIRKKATWIGDMYLGLGLKGQSLSICISTIEDLKLTWTAL